MNNQIALETCAHQEVLEQAQFLFMSSHCSIKGRGVFEQISTPVSASGTNGQSDERFHKQLHEAMSRARACGIANPIVIGAIPFDLSQPTCLSIPRSYEVFSRELDGMQRNASILSKDRVSKDSASKDRNASQESVPKDSTPSVVLSRSLPDEARFKQAVQQAIANFQLSDIRKAVLSRVLDVELDQTADVDSIFARLLAQNPSGYHFRMPVMEEGAWSGAELIGASPELLVRRQGRAIHSNPLAGSARRHEDPEQDRHISETLLQSDKDAYEHRLVIDDIRAQLAPLCTELDVPSTPSLMNTRAMWHLSTRIDGILADPSTTALQLACRLHPTPAVCGFPTRQARKLINLVEPFDRGLFTGMVGWCDAEGNGEWVVTIRCGLVNQKRIRLFAGAGIVEDSCPESEWAETQAKLQTMLSALGVDLHSQNTAQPHANANANTQTEEKIAQTIAQAMFKTTVKSTPKAMAMSNAVSNKVPNSMSKNTTEKVG